MKTLLLILVLLFGGASSLYARFKRTLAEDGNAADGSGSSDYDGGSAERDFFDFDGIEAEEAVPAQPTYFTYEDSAFEMKTESVGASIQQEEVPVALRPAFDLRQAVIYQTLLDNRYITNLE